MKMPNFTFSGAHTTVNKQQQIFLSLSKLECSTYIKHFHWNEINATKFWDLQIQVTFSLLLPKWMRKLSNNLKMILLWLILRFTGLGSRYSKGGSSESKFPNQVLSWGCSWGTHARNNTALVFSASKGSHFEHGHLLSARGICSPCFLCSTS